MVGDRCGPIRVIVVDDSATVRDLLTAILRAEGIHVVGTGANGEEAVQMVHRLRPDVVTLDVRMPKMDGLAATRRIMREMPTPIVIVANSLMHADTDLTFEALKAGALTVVRKPGLNDPETCNQVIQAVRLMAGVPVIHHWGRRDSIASNRARQAMERRTLDVKGRALGSTCGDRSFDIRNSKFDIRIVGIASSTGGPAALSDVLGRLPADFPLPILVVQHVSPGFAIGLAEWLNTQTPLRVSLAGHGQTPQPGGVLLAPDDYHMQVNHRRVVELNKEPPYKGLRPSANFLFGSLARAYGGQAAGIVLTGMGDDGAEGLEALHLAGGLTMAQDEPSCVVYGMPCEAVARQAVDQVLSPEQIALALGQLARNGNGAGRSGVQ